jgi:hypothetical protein
MAKGKREPEDKLAAEKHRATRRAEVNLPLKYLIISGQDEMQISRSVDGVMEDLSLSGVLFKANSMRIDGLHLSYDESPQVRNKLTLEIDLPRRKITAIGEVSWYERSFVARDTTYHVGVSFTELNSEDREALKDFLISQKRTVEALALDV